MAFALEGYGLLKVSGKNQGLDGLRKEMSARLTKGRRALGVRCCPRWRRSAAVSLSRTRLASRTVPIARPGEPCVRWICLSSRERTKR